MNQGRERKEKNKKRLSMSNQRSTPPYTLFIYRGDTKHFPNAVMKTGAWLTSEATCTTHSVWEPLTCWRVQYRHQILLLIIFIFIKILNCLSMHLIITKNNHYKNKKTLKTSLINFVLWSILIILLFWKKW